jgi:trk system potassium uptake protein TrkH
MPVVLPEPGLNRNFGVETRGYMNLDKSLAAVSYAVRPAVVVCYFGTMCLMLALAGLVPLAVALLVHEPAYALYQVLVCAGLAAAGLLCSRHRPPVEMQRNEALVIVVLTFVAAALAFALPMTARGLSFASALFESVSGITTTGLTTIAAVEAEGRGVLFTAAWLQWIGGLGILVLGFAMLSGQGINAMRLTGVLAEQSDMIGGTRAYGRIVLGVYSSLTGVGILLLHWSGLDWYAAATLGLAAISTGGYSPYNASIAGLDAHTQAILMALCTCGAFSMLLYYRLWRGEWRAFALDPELRAFWLLALLAAAGLALSLWHAGGMSAGKALWNGLVTALSAQSTTGFSSVPVHTLDTGSKLLLVFAMLTGGGVGSTAGGMKLLRILIVLSLVRRLILRSRVSEHSVTPTRFLGREWSSDMLLGTLLVVILHLLVTGLSWLAFLPWGYDPLDALFEVTSATGTVGLSAGITSASLPGPLQGVLIADMLLGRLEIVAILVFLAPRTWIGQRRGNDIPENKE